MSIEYPVPSIENPTLAHFRHFSSLFTNLPSTIVENPLQIALFMQNKPNFQKAQMNVSTFSQMAYENKRDSTPGENKPNTNPNKPNFPEAQMNLNSVLTKDYENKPLRRLPENKPNQIQCRNSSKAHFSACRKCHTRLFA